MIVLWASIVPEGLFAQDRYLVTRQDNFRRDAGPSGTLLGQVSEGTELPAVSNQDGWIQVELEGWMWGQSLGSTDRDGFDLEVVARPAENLRDYPDGPVRARLQRGVLLREIERRGNWVFVRRAGWMYGTALRRVSGSVVPSGTPSTPSTPSTNPQPSSGSLSLDRAVIRVPTVLHTVPDGDTTASVPAETSVRIVARSGDWVRVQMEGWVLEENLRAQGDGVLVGVSGAEVRAQPEEFEGQILQWSLRFLALETGDGVRPEIPEGRHYLLTRGPIPEVGFVYVLLSDDQIAQAERLTSLAQIQVLVRVVKARDRFLGQPVVELLDLAVVER